MKIRKQFFPASLARYMAISASSRSSPGPVVGSPVTTTPTLAVTVRSRPCFVMGWPIDRTSSLGEQARVVGVAEAAEHHELVSAEAGDGVGLPHSARQPPGDLDEHLVAGLMPECVVDRLEVVEVDEQEGDATGAALQGQEGLGKPVLKRGPVGQARYLVVQRLVGEGLLRLDLGGYVPRDAKGADDGSLVRLAGQPWSTAPRRPDGRGRSRARSFRESVRRSG